MKKLYLHFFTLSIVIIISFSQALAQCKTFAKKDCIPEMSPYIHDGQINSTLIAEGESIELYKTFYEGQDYRVLVCVGEKFKNKKVRIRLLDHNRKVLYDSQDQQYAMSWDFVANSTQQVIIEVSAVKNTDEKAELVTDCVAILIGFLNTDGLIKK